MKTIVAIHGNSTSRDIWNKFKLALKGRAEVITVDIPGHGGNTLDWEISFDDAASNIIDQIYSKIAPHTKIHIIGASLGGHLAVQIANRISDRVKCVFVMGTPLTSPLITIPQFVPRTDLIKSVLERGLLFKEEKFTVEEAEDFSKCQGPPDEDLPMMIEAALATSKYARGISKDLFTNPRDEVKCIIESEVQLYHIHGIEDAAVNPEHIKREVDLIPNAVYVEFNGTHSLSLTNAQQLADYCYEMMTKEINH